MPGAALRREAAQDAGLKRGPQLGLQEGVEKLQVTGGEGQRAHHDRRRSQDAAGQRARRTQQQQPGHARADQEEYPVV